MSPQPIQLVSIKRANTQRTPCEDESRDWSEASTCQQSKKLLAKHQKLGEKHGVLPHSPYKTPTL